MKGCTVIARRILSRSNHQAVMALSSAFVWKRRKIVLRLPRFNDHVLTDISNNPTIEGFTNISASRPLTQPPSLITVSCVHQLPTDQHAPEEGEDALLLSWGGCLRDWARPLLVSGSLCPSQDLGRKQPRLARRARYRVPSTVWTQFPSSRKTLTRAGGTALRHGRE